MEGLSLAVGADILTVVGFLVTLRVWHVTGSLSKKFLRRARLPQIRKELETRSSDLLIAMTRKDAMEIGGIMAKVGASLESVGDKLPSRKTKTIRSLQKRVKLVVERSEFDELLTKSIYVELLGVIQHLKGLEEDNVIGVEE
ncbi:hypothetical protein [Stenotrophomonas maltophilia]|uniref:hypothetical protein n=1 Tax=Stenotrophomonas maltophilia TaxID=40324 RepID=UPI0015DF7426|nr:hypothetical protein [Stenotrophomonas maltophilia]